MLRTMCALAAVGSMIVLGCGQSSAPSLSRSSEVSDAASPNRADQVSFTSDGDIGQAIGLAATDGRKVIYNGTMEIEVPDLSAFEKTLAAQLAASGGFVVNFQENRRAGSLRQGRWVLRIPSGQFRDLVDALSTSGVARLRKIDAEDVTEEFVDLEARLAAQRKYYERIEAIVQNRQGNIEEIVRLEAELQKIQEELERLQGRLNYLENHTSFSTLTIAVSEEQPFVARVTPGFDDRLRNAWHSSWSGVKRCGEWLAVTGAWSAPWAAFCGPLVGLTYFGARRWRRREAK